MQVMQLRDLGINAAALHGGTDKAEERMVMDTLTAMPHNTTAPVSLLYLTPEKITKSKRMFSKVRG
jgi:superfamily II DNA helicase RecQ